MQGDFFLQQKVKRQRTFTTRTSTFPTEDLCWRMTTIFSFLVCKVFLKIVIEDPLFMCSNQILPGLGRLEVPISHTSLYIKCTFYIVLPALPLLNFFLLNAQGLVNVPGSMVEENAAVIADQVFRASVF